jgi:hypothetical protein
MTTARSLLLAMPATSTCMVFVVHPIQDRTDDEMRALAEAAVDEVLAQLVAPR